MIASGCARTDAVFLKKRAERPSGPAPLPISRPKRKRKGHLVQGKRLIKSRSIAGVAWNLKIKGFLPEVGFSCVGG